MTSHVAGYMDSVKDQEIPIKYIQHKRKCDQEKIPTMMNKCIYVTPTSKMLHI